MPHRHSSPPSPAGGDAPEKVRQEREEQERKEQEEARKKRKTKNAKLKRCPRPRVMPPRSVLTSGSKRNRRAPRSGRTIWLGQRKFNNYWT